MHLEESCAKDLEQQAQTSCPKNKVYIYDGHSAMKKIVILEKTTDVAGMYVFH